MIISHYQQSNPLWKKDVSYNNRIGSISIQQQLWNWKCRSCIKVPRLVQETGVIQDCWYNTACSTWLWSALHNNCYSNTLFCKCTMSIQRKRIKALSHCAENDMSMRMYFRNRVRHRKQFHKCRMAKYHSVFMAITQDYMRRINDKKRSNSDQWSSIIESTQINCCSLDWSEYICCHPNQYDNSFWFNTVKTVDSAIYQAL